MKNREQLKEECETYLSKIYNLKIPYLDKMIDLGLEEIQKKLDHERAKEIHQRAKEIHEMKIEELNNQIKLNNIQTDNHIKVNNSDTENHIKVNNSEIELNKSKIELNNSKRRFWFW